MAIVVRGYKHKGLTVDAAYIRVEQYAGGKFFQNTPGGALTGLAKVYASKDAANPKPVQVGTKPPVEEGEEGEPIMETPAPEFLLEVAVRCSSFSPGMVPETALYSALKSMDQFAGAVDA